MTVTDDLSQFGYRELEEAGKLLSQIKDIDDSGELKVYFNNESGFVFLSDSDIRVWVLDSNDKIAEFFTCSNCGNEGILKDFKEQISDCSDCEELYIRESEEDKCNCCQEWVSKDDLEGDMCTDCSNDKFYCESCDTYKSKDENERDDMCDSCFEDQEDDVEINPILETVWYKCIICDYMGIEDKMIDHFQENHEGQMWDNCSKEIEHI